MYNELFKRSPNDGGGMVLQLDIGADKAISGGVDRQLYADFLREHPQLDASFADLSQNYPDIGQLFGNDKHWIYEEGKRYLAKSNIFALFTTTPLYERSMQDGSYFRESMNLMFREYRKTKEKPLEWKNFPEFDQNKFYDESTVRDFLMYALDRISGRRRQAMQITFRNAGNFMPEVVRKEPKQKIVKAKLPREKVVFQKPVGRETIPVWQIPDLTTGYGAEILKSHAEEMRELGNKTDFALRFISLARIEALALRVYETKTDSFPQRNAADKMTGNLNSLLEVLVWNTSSNPGLNREVSYPVLKTKERETFYTQVLKPLVQTVFPDGQADANEAEIWKESSIIYENFVNLAWLFSEAGKYEDFGFQTIFYPIKPRKPRVNVKQRSIQEKDSSNNPYQVLIDSMHR